MKRRKASYLTVTDLFCGAGGSSQGAIAAGAEVVVAANHWKRAIETYGHNLGNRVRIVDEVDISACDPRRYPSTRIGIMTAECTTHSPAGGNRRRRPPQRDLFIPDVRDPSFIRSRVTMWDVVRFAEYHQYDAIITENVVEAATLWVLFPQWLEAMHALGYEHKVVSLNSMFCHPTPQSRDRIYVIFWRKGNRAPDLDIRPWAPCPRCTENVRARQSWKNGRGIGKYRRQYVYTCPSCKHIVEPYYYAGLNIIDPTIPAERIGDRDEPLVERSRERIRYGLEKYGRRMLLINIRQGERDSSRAKPADASPIGTIPTWTDYFALAHPPSFLVNSQHSTGGRHARPLDEPTMTVTAAGQRPALVSLASPFFVKMRGGEASHLRNASGPVTDPLWTVCTGNHFAVVQGAALLSQRDAKAMHVDDLAGPVMTQVAARAPQTALIANAPFLVQYYGTQNASPLDAAVPVITSVDRHALVEPTSPVSIDDCYYRLIEPHESGRAMAFGDDYVVLGTKGERTRQYGQAVTPPAMELLFRRVAASLEPSVEYDAA